MDEGRINIIISDIKKYFEELRGMNINKIEDIDTIKFRAASMDIFSIINRTIDLAEEITTSKNLGFPSEYKELFTLLERAKIIDEKKENKLKDLIILRNRISHRYGTIKKEEIFHALKKIEIVNDFIKDVVEDLKTQKNK